MGFFHFLFDNDWLQRADIEQLRAESDRVTTALNHSTDSVRRADERIAELEESLAHLALFNRTLLRMLIEKRVCTTEEFANLFRMIDVEDGVADGKMTPKPSTADS